MNGVAATVRNRLFRTVAQHSDMAADMRRVVVTGMGVVCPLGSDVPSYWENLLAGKSGISFITDFPTEKLRSDIAGTVRNFDARHLLTRKECDIYGRVTQMSLVAATEAMDAAGLGGWMCDNVPGREAREHLPAPALDRWRAGCLVSTGQGSVDIFERQVERSRLRGPRAVSPFFVPGVMPNSGTALIAMRFGLRGPSYSLASACATGTHSIATSTLMIEAGEANIMVAGGAEAATRQNTVAGFGNARALAKARDGDPTTACRPYDVDRSGFVMSEGAGVLVLEEEQHALARGAKPLAYVAGFGMTTDARHLTSPDDAGLGLAMAAQRALERANITASDVGYINPHATSTKKGDGAEVAALQRVFGDRLTSIPMSATKSMVGHTLGGAGGVETIAVVCSLRDQLLHPSINVDQLDPSFPLDLVRQRQAVNFEYALKLSAGFGGHNCVLVMQRY